MDTQQLEAFVAITHHKSYTLASYSLHMSQSSLSKQIFKLEEKLNLTLFDRSKRQIQLTESGQAFLPLARQMLELHQKSLQLHSMQKETLKIMSLPFCGEAVHALFEVFEEKHPQFQIQMHELEERDLIENHTLDYDAYLLRNEFEPFKNLEKIELSKEKLIVIAPNNTQLKSPLAPQDLDHASLLLYPDYTKIAQSSLAYFQKHSLHYTIKKHARMHTLLRHCRQHEGLIIAPEHVQEDYSLSGLKVLQIQDSPVTAIFLYISKSAEKKKGMQALSQFLKTAKKGGSHF